MNGSVYLLLKEEDWWLLRNEVEVVVDDYDERNISEIGWRTILTLKKFSCINFKRTFI